MSDYVAKTLEAYNADPDKYEQSTRSMIMRPELETLVSLLPSKSGSVLDAGCAYGKDMVVLHDEYHVNVTGIDMSDALLERAKTIHQEFKFAKMDVRNLSFENESIAGIWCNAVLLHLNDADITVALQEFHRALVPEGALCVSFKEGLGSEEIVEKFSSNRARYYNFQTLESTQSMLADVGFVVRQSYVVNERERFGPEKRDLNWIYAFATKTS